jgi:molybdate transport system substrate-binding protein
VRFRQALPVVVAFVLAACASPGGSPSASLPAASAAGSPSPSVAPAPVELTIYGAASLAGVLDDAKTVYAAEHPGVTLVVSTDSSATLRTQIEQGAPADVFLSADTKNPQTLADAGLADGGLVPFAGNRLTIIVPSDNPAGIKTPADLAKRGVKIVAAGDEVPITKYALQAVDKLAALPGYPAGFAASYAANVVSKEDNVKSIVAKIGTGNGDAGIVYVTDALASTVVTRVDIPPEGSVLASYTGVVVRASAHHAAARTFLDWLAGPIGKAILASHGFIAAP